MPRTAKAYANVTHQLVYVETFRAVGVPDQQTTGVPRGQDVHLPSDAGLRDALCGSFVGSKHSHHNRRFDMYLVDASIGVYAFEKVLEPRKVAD